MEYKELRNLLREIGYSDEQMEYMYNYCLEKGNPLLCRLKDEGKDWISLEPERLKELPKRFKELNGDLSHMNLWKLSKEEHDRWMPVIQQYLNRLEALSVQDVETMGDEAFVLHLTGLGLSPYKLELLLKELGYETYYNYENGWQIDFWIGMQRTDDKTFPSLCEKLCIEGCAVTFTLQLYPSELM